MGIPVYKAEFFVWIVYSCTIGEADEFFNPANES